MSAIDIITGRIRRYELLIADLEEVRRELLQAERGETTAAIRYCGCGDELKPEPEPEAPTAGKAGAGDEGRRLALARTLHSRGPMGLTQLSNAVQVPQPVVSKLLKHPWFAKAGPSVRAPWCLSDLGRDATSTASASGAANGSPPAGDPAT